MGNETVNTDKYEGPGRLASALGDAKLYIIGGTLAGAAGGAAVGATLKPDGKMAQRLTDLAHTFSRAEAKEALSDIKGSKAGLVVAGAVVGAAVLSSVGAVWGVVKGWGKAGKGRQQFEALKAERDDARQSLEALQSQVQGIKVDVAGQKKFTEMHPSRAELGSHVAAHEATKAYGASTEVSR